MPAHAAKSANDGMRPGRKEEKASQGPSLFSDLLLLVLKIAIVAVFAVIVLVFLFGVVQAHDESMDPAVREGDLVMYYRLEKSYAANDLVVVNDGGTKEVRRVIAVAGDTVDFSKDGLMINGYRQAEDHIFTETLPFSEGITYPVTLKPGQVFVMGDNRDQAVDSRLYGPVDIESGTEGKVITVIRRRNF